jgi:hypothetical protein
LERHLIKQPLQQVVLSFKELGPQPLSLLLLLPQLELEP